MSSVSRSSAPRSRETDAFEAQQDTKAIIHQSNTYDDPASWSWQAFLGKHQDSTISSGLFNATRRFMATAFRASPSFPKLGREFHKRGRITTFLRSVNQLLAYQK